MYLSVFFQVIIREADGKRCKDQLDTTNKESLNESSPSNPSPQSSRSPAEEEAERLHEPEVVEDARKTRPSESIKQDSYALT